MLDVKRGYPIKFLPVVWNITDVYNETFREIQHEESLLFSDLDLCTTFTIKNLSLDSTKTRLALLF